MECNSIVVAKTRKCEIGRFCGFFVGVQLLTYTIFVQGIRADTTYVGGLIDVNTTWTLAGSPYIVIGDIKVDTLITLRIEPGVEVRFKPDKYMMIVGTLKAIGTATDSIIITKHESGRWGRLWFKPASAGSLKYCRIEYANNSAIYEDSAFSLYIGYCTISNNSTWRGGGIWSSGSPMITNNTITNNSATGDKGGGIYTCGSPTITYNTISFNHAIGDGWNSGCGGGICSEGGSPMISYNIISDNSVSTWWGDIYGCGIYSSGSATIIHNTISYNYAGSNDYAYGGGIYSSGHPTISYNTIFKNDLRPGYYLRNYGGGIYSSDSATITYNTISYNYAEQGGGGIWNQGPSIISHNTITHTQQENSIYSSGSAKINNNLIINTSPSEYHAIYTDGSCEIANNTIIINSAVNGITNTGSSTIIKENTIFCSSREGRCVYNISGSPQLSYNTIIGEIYFASGADSARINYCNLYPCSSYWDTTCYIVYNNTDKNIDATNNWWGTTNTDSINWSIWDIYDDFNLGKVNYNPILTSGDTTAPVPPPFNLTADTSQATKIILSWDSVLVADLAGYKVWYDTDTSGFPYNGTGANEGNSPIDVGNITTFELTGLTASIYYVAVTAYDNGGDSSWYSNEVIAHLVGVKEETSKYKLQSVKLEIYPNPAFSNVVLKYDLPKASNINLSIYDVSGKLVKTICLEEQEKGHHKVDIGCEKFAKGIYFIKFKTGDSNATRKLVILR